MRISYDPNKRSETLAERELDFEHAIDVFMGRTFEAEDARRNYGEQRIVCYGYLESRLVVICYTPRGEIRHVISMRKANAREQKEFEPYL